MKAWIISLFLLMPVIILGQNPIEINLSITDTVITVKKNTNKNRYAAKANVEINVPDLQDTLFIYLFNKYVSAGFYRDIEPFDNYKEKSAEGLNFILEDKNHHIIENRLTLVSYVNFKAETRAMRTRAFVNSKLEIKNKVLNDIELRNYRLAKYEITNETQSLVLYPLLGRNFILSKGEYYLYFVYVFNPEFPYIGFSASIASDSRTYKGAFVSNKVKLIYHKFIK